MWFGTSGRARRRAITALAGLAVALTAVACSGTSDGPVAAQPGSSLVGAARPNIVFVLTDDFSSDLVRYMPHVRELEAAGMRFTNYTVSDSLCCPSRASIFTGEFPHDTGVYHNVGPDGGFDAYQAHQDYRNSFAVALRRAGYRTGFMGKYLNGYNTNSTDGSAAQGGARGATVNYVPPGWSTWAGQDRGYSEFNYVVNYNHHLVSFGHEPADYGVYTLDRLGRRFVTSCARAGAPFLLELATFAPHHPYVPAYADRGTFPGLRAPRTPAWDTTPTGAPHWLARHRHLSAAEIAKIDHAYRLRVESVQSVDRMIGHLLDALRSTGQLANTYFVFSSDNGLHMGQYRLSPGKLSAFDTDVNVPLVITGPGVAAGSVSAAVTQNVDLAPTFEQIAGLAPGPTVDGASLLPLLHGASTASWRNLALVEHHGTDFARYPNDPDKQPTSAGGIPTYEALRSATFTYVRYRDGEREYYDRSHDPYELDNLAATLSPRRIATLDARLDALAACRGAAQCWAAARDAAG